MLIENYINTTHSRKRCMKRLLYPINIVVAYIPFDDKLLLNKRIDEPYKNMWSLVGGHLELGETIEECIVREVKEETTLEATFVALRGIASEIISEQGKPIDHFILWVCEVSVSYDKALEQDEGEMRWFSLEEIEIMKERIIESDYLMLHNFIFKDKTRLDVHKVQVQKNGETYKVEYFGL